METGLILFIAALPAMLTLETDIPLWVTIPLGVILAVGFIWLNMNAAKVVSRYPFIAQQSPLYRHLRKKGVPEEVLNEELSQNETEKRRILNGKRMDIKHGNGTTEYGPGIDIELTGDEVATAIDAWLVSQGVHVDGPRTIFVNGELVTGGRVYVDPAGFVIADGTKISGRG